MIHVTPVADMMRESAVPALQWSREHCGPTPDGKPDCGWYHGFWQIARALGVGKFAGGHATFLVDVLREQARAGGYRRVLVSGTADYAMAALVYQAYEAEHAPVELTVIDWCETPLALTRWYAERIGRPVHTVRSNILDLPPSGDFDLVLTNSFLGYFERQQRPALFGRWAGALRSGGKAIVTNRVRPHFGGDLVGFEAAEADRFCREVDDRAVAGGAMLGLDPETIRALAHDYVRRFGVHPVTSHEDVHRDLRDAGFSRLAFDVAASAVVNTTISGPSTTEQGMYARIVATRD